MHDRRARFAIRPGRTEARAVTARLRDREDALSAVDRAHDHVQRITDGERPARIEHVAAELLDRDLPEGVVVHLNGNFGLGGHAEGDTFELIQNVNGSYYDDTLTGDVGDNRLEGFDRADVLAGLFGDDELHGGEGIDTADYSLSASRQAGGLFSVTVNLSTGEAYGDDAEGDSFLSIENVTGSADWDTLTGDDKANVLDGRAGNDALVGLGGADTLIGGDDTEGDSVGYDASPRAWWST